jgi:hypothetical protein
VWVTPDRWGDPCDDQSKQHFFFISKTLIYLSYEFLTICLYQNNLHLGNSMKKCTYRPSYSKSSAETLRTRDLLSIIIIGLVELRNERSFGTKKSSSHLKQIPTNFAKYGRVENACSRLDKKGRDLIRNCRNVAIILSDSLLTKGWNSEPTWLARYIACLL